MDFGQSVSAAFLCWTFCGGEKMQAKTKKKVLIAVSVFLLLVIFAAGGVGVYLKSLPSPLEAYDFNDCTVELYAKWTNEPYIEMTEIDTEIFKNGLQNIRVFPLEMRNPPDGVTGGRLHQFCVHFSDGSTLDVGVQHDCLILGDKWYRCDAETANPLYWLEQAYNTQYSAQYAAPASGENTTAS